MFLLKTFTKSEYEITDEQEAYLRTVNLEGSITVNGNTIKASNIAEIIKIKEDNEYKQIETPERVVYNKEQFIRALSEIIKGFKKHFGDRILPPRSQTILSHMEYRLEKARQSKDNKFSSPLKPFYNNY